jgi:cobalt/nickel transport system ATP-binding protein
VTALNHLNAAGKTVITATHVLETARELADRVWIIGDNHRLISDGDVCLLDDERLLSEAGILR